MTSQQFLVCDNSNLTNFKSWASAVSAFFASAGWLQASDTGQVNWGTIASVPGSGAYVYEIWEPNDSLTNFYAKVEYGNYSGSSNSPSVRISIGTGTNGAGTLTGSTIGPFTGQQASFAPASSSATYECDLSGAAGRISCLMWRTEGGLSQVFAIERSLNNSGAYTGTYVTVFMAGDTSTGYNGGAFSQQSLFLGGAGPATNLGANNVSLQRGWAVRLSNASAGTGNTSAFNGTMCFDTPAPVVGYFDNPCTVVGVACYADLVEGVAFNVTLYGSLRTYIPTKAGGLGGSPWNTGTNMSCTCVRYD